MQVNIAGPELESTLVLPIAAEQPNGRLWMVSDGRLVATEPKLHFRTPTHLVVEAFNSGEGVVLGAVPGGREGLEVTVNLSE